MRYPGWHFELLRWPTCSCSFWRRPVGWGRRCCAVRMLLDCSHPVCWVFFITGGNGTFLRWAGSWRLLSVGFVSCWRDSCCRTCQSYNYNLLPKVIALKSIKLSILHMYLLSYTFSIGGFEEGWLVPSSNYNNHNILLLLMQGEAPSFTIKYLPCA